MISIPADAANRIGSRTNFNYPDLLKNLSNPATAKKKHRDSVQHAVLMTQREFAERVAASPGGRDYGSLSVAVQVFADVELGPIVSGDSFHPPTAVQSRVMKLSFLKTPRVEIVDPEHFEVVVRAAFSQRRKKILNSMLSRGRWSREVLLEALEKSAISPDARAEQIDIHRFAALAQNLINFRM